MNKEKLVGKYVRDNSEKYSGDIGYAEGTRKDYVVVNWRGKAKHAAEYGSYKPDTFGLFKRFKVLKDDDVPKTMK